MYTRIEDFQAKRIRDQRRSTFAANKRGSSYQKVRSTSAKRWVEYEKPGLYAVIMPGGCGKTTLCETYGFIDVDDIACEPELAKELTDMRQRLLRARQPDWTEHNVLWFGALRRALASYDFEEHPNVVLLHSEECAHEIGALPIAAVIPTARLHRSGLKSRAMDQVALELARLNVDVVANETKDCDIYEVDSFNERDRIVLGMISQYMPIPAPLSFWKGEIERDDECWPDGYSRDTPDWVLRGTVPDSDCFEQVVRMVEEGTIPPVARAWYAKKMFGVIENVHGKMGAAIHWVAVAGECHRLQPNGFIPNFNRVATDPNTDWFEVFPHDSEMSKNRSNVGIRRILNMIHRQLDNVEIGLLQNRRGETHNFVTSLLVYWQGVAITLRPKVREALLRSGVLHVKESAFVRMASRFHNLIRATNSFMGLDLNLQEVSSLMYLPSLIGRHMYKIDPMVEIEKRFRELSDVKKSFDGVGWSNDQYYKDLAEGVTDAYRREVEKPRTYDLDGFAKFYGNRKRHMAKGSTVLMPQGFPKEYVCEFVTEASAYFIEQRHNKKSLFQIEEIGPLMEQFILDNPGFNHTKFVPKLNETGGKERALLPGSLAHYVVFTYLLVQFEYVQQIGAVRLNDSHDGGIFYADRMLAGLGYQMMYDYADFNAQHSSREMEMVMSSLKTIVSGDHAFFEGMLWWLCQSFYKMVGIDEKGGEHKMKSGLFSGWRGTTWINSVLNHAYFFVARKSYMKLFGHEPTLYYDGGGDDVQEGMPDATTAFRMYYVMETVGFEATAIKQLMGKTTEFYRLMAREGEIQASVTRAIGTYVAGNWEGTGGDLRDRLSSAVSNIDMLIRRGMDKEYGIMLYHAAIMHWSRIKEDEKWTSPTDVVLHGRLQDGGLGVPDVDGKVWVLKNKLPLPDEMLIKFTPPAVSATVDWLKQVQLEVADAGMKLVVTAQDVADLSADDYNVEKAFESIVSKEFGEQFSTYWHAVEEVVGKEGAGQQDPDPEMLHAFLQWANDTEGTSRLYHEYLKAGRYKHLIRFFEIGGQKVKKEEYYRMMVGNYNFRELESTNFQLPLGIRCPEYIRTAVKEMVAEMVLCDELNAQQGGLLYAKIACTYEIYYHTWL